MLFEIPNVFVIALAGASLAIPAGLSLFCKNEKINKICSVVGTILYSIFAIVLTLFSNGFGLENVGIGFVQSTGWFSKTINYEFWNFGLKDAIINTLMFTPLGVMNAQKNNTKGYSHSLSRSLAFGALLSLGIEFGQFMLPIARFPDLADVMFNTLSAGIGCTGLFACHKVKEILVNNYASKKQLVNINERENVLINTKSDSLINTNIIHNINKKNNNAVHAIHIKHKTTKILEPTMDNHILSITKQDDELTY